MMPLPEDPRDTPRPSQHSQPLPTFHILYAANEIVVVGTDRNLRTPYVFII